jgi:hypothetical protein
MQNKDVQHPVVDCAAPAAAAAVILPYLAPASASFVSLRSRQLDVAASNRQALPATENAVDCYTRFFTYTLQLGQRVQSIERPPKDACAALSQACVIIGRWAWPISTNSACVRLYSHVIHL